VETYTPGSFTKNFGWDESYDRLHQAIVSGFSAGLAPVSRELWRTRCGIRSSDLQLVPGNFFLYSMQGIKDDFFLVDRLVERAARPYSQDFAWLALFAFHLANSGRWRGSKWRDGRVAGWANSLIREAAWKDGQWLDEPLTKLSLDRFLEARLVCTDYTRRKVVNNYHFMLVSAGVIVGEKVQPIDFRAHWPIDATQLFWDRQIFDGLLSPSSDRKPFEAAFFDREIHKLLGCSEAQGRAFVGAAFRDYGARMENRARQIEDLRAALVA
jgi:hypothetical protein